MLEMRSIDVEAKGGVNGMTCLMEAIYSGHLDICRLLLDKGSQLEAEDNNGWTPLLYAAGENSVEIFRLLCDHGADVEARRSDGLRPLHRAAYYGQMSIVKELIEERNAEINARDVYGTALWYARQYGNPDVAAYLFSRGGIE
jgi:ankyrin repeat protein